ncbi:hypothetical protein CPC08DRAFT_650852, partial [Agrocybe pediades]
IREILEQYSKRCETLGADLPVLVVVDNCCQVRRSIAEAIPNVLVVLDVYHFMMRYLGSILNGSRNPHRAEVAKDIRDSILESGSSKGKLAKYWTKEEQARRLSDTYDKWAQNGTVWTAATSKIHADQLAHVQRGCLARQFQNIASDGSRIEGSHKGWNSLQQAQPSGIEVYSILAHDFVLRRNVRACLKAEKIRTNLTSTDQLVLFSCGLHHVQLANHIAETFNILISQSRGGGKQGTSNSTTLPALPTLQKVNTSEVFGLVKSTHARSFGGLIEIKEDNDEHYRILEEIATRESAESPTSLLPPSASASNLDHPTDECAVSEITAAAPSNSSKRKTAPSRHDSRTGNPSRLAALVDSLPLPPQSSKLTRSQLIYSASTSIDPRSLSIEQGYEFFLFMDLRLSQQWSSFTMTSQKWANATKLYNEARLEHSRAKGLSPPISKNPRALMEKLSNVEGIIIQRLAKKDFMSKGGSEAFWKKHCFAVSLIKSEPSSAFNPASSTSHQKPAICTRCKTIMYPGPTGSSENHKKGHCSNGVKQKAKLGSPDSDTHPDWPQPAGVFSNGTHFHPVAFLTAIRQLYDKVIDGAISEKDYSMEDLAFSRMLRSRMVEKSGRSLFRLYSDLELDKKPVDCSSIVVEEDSVRYLQVSCLEDGIALA